MSSKMIDNTLSDVGETLNSVMTEENISELNLKFKLDPNLKYSIGQLLDVHIQKDEPSVLLDPSTKLTCQIVSEDVTKVTAVHTTNFDKSAFHKTSNITCVTSLLPEGKIAVADNDSSSILVFNGDGSIVKTVRFKKSSRNISCSYVGKDRLAVTFRSTETIKMLETMKYTELQEMKLNKPCWGIHCVNDMIFVAIRNIEILVLDLAGNAVKTFPTNQNNLIYVHAFKDLHFRSDFEEGCVCCYNSTGNKLWQFKNDNTKGARNMCTDAFGNIFVACQDSNSVVMIAKDGKRSKTVLEISKPKSVCFDTRNFTLFVISLHGDHFSSYKICYS